MELKTKCFCQILGFICFFLGLVVFVMDLKCPDDINTFFGNDTLNDLEEFYVSADELKELGIEIDTPSGGSVSTTVESLNGSVKSINSLLNGRASTTPTFRGPVKRISNITIPDIEEEDEEEPQGREVIQMFRRKTKSIHNLANRLKRNLQIKPNESHLQTAVPAPESPIMPSSPVYKNVSPITEEEPREEAYENVDVQKSAQNSNNNNQRVPWKLLPEGKTIRAKTKGPVERRKNKKH